MSGRIGIGIGIGIDGDRVRAVIVDGSTGAALAAAEVPISHTGRDGLVAAVIRAAAAIVAPPAPVRVAWLPPEASVLATDVTGRHPARLAAGRCMMCDARTTSRVPRQLRFAVRWRVSAPSSR